MEYVKLYEIADLSSVSGLQQLLKTLEEVKVKRTQSSDDAYISEFDSSLATDNPESRSEQSSENDALKPTSEFTNLTTPASFSSSGQLSGCIPSGGSKRCKCKRSRCLKFYCECFAANQICSEGECFCDDCWNTSRPEHAKARAEAILVALDKNPKAFSGKKAVVFRGCHCKKSGCLKKYCDCYGMGVKCTANCRCTQCENREVPYSQATPRSKKPKLNITSTDSPQPDSPTDVELKKRKFGSPRASNSTTAASKVEDSKKVSKNVKKKEKDADPKKLNFSPRSESSEQQQIQSFNITSTTTDRIKLSVAEFGAASSPSSSGSHKVHEISSLKLVQQEVTDESNKQATQNQTNPITIISFSPILGM